VATYRYDGDPLTFPTIRLADGSQLVAEPGETYDLAEETSDPRFTSVASVPTPADSSISADPATTGSRPEATVTPKSPETALDASQTPANEQGA